ncbi:MAG: hypothetical protein AAF598_05690, partial [Bacteroidota bacterium]
GRLTGKWIQLWVGVSPTRREAAQTAPQFHEFTASGRPLPDSPAKIVRPRYPTHHRSHLRTAPVRSLERPHREFDVDRTVTPCPHNPLGVKGAGEAGCIGSTPAVVNAVLDALAPFKVHDIVMPMTPERVWNAMNNGH